jgi:hypothetical protein
MISPICDKCKEKLCDYGAMLFPPPFKVDKEDDFTPCKYHLCQKCSEEVMVFMRGYVYVE